jgi:RHS repeat-associated protein
MTINFNKKLIGKRFFLNPYVKQIFYNALGRITQTLENPVAGGTASDENVEIQCSYDGVDNELTIIAVNPTTGNQITKYLYEDSYNASLQTSAIYPDSSDTNSSGTDQVKNTYYLDGNIKTQTDQNGNVRTFSYDFYRRPITDTVTTLGNNVVGTVRKLALSFTTRGALEKVTSIDSTNAILNEVRYEYDSNLKLKKLQQSHSGAVTTSTPFLEYSYDAAHDNRLSGVVYPHGKVLTYSYNNFDNVSSINEGTTPLVSYLYNGSGNPMQTIYNEPNASLTYANGGLDRYGRIINHSWVKNTDPLVHIIHSYDYNGNRTKRYDPVHAANSELYTYDNLGQIKSLNRGIPNNDHTAVTTVNHNESWNFDKTGNWVQYTKNGTTENRTHNAANELQGIATHDANGNMVLMPGLKGKYDAWNRLIEVRDSSDNLIAQYEYNGLNQRIKKTIGSTVTKSFFNENWQEVESITNNQVTSYVWGLRYIDDLVLREKGEERLYSFADPNWNVIAICNNSGVVQERYTYDAFGKQNVFDEDFTAKMETEFNWNRTFTGQVCDCETGLMLYRNRYYNMELGIFIVRDPIGYMAHDKNIYRYVFNNPCMYTDILGFECCGDQEYDPSIQGCCDNVLYKVATQCCKNGVVNDRYKICIRSEPSHSWIYVKNLHTSEEHTYSRFRYSHNPSGKSKVCTDIELKTGRKCTHERCDTICGFTPTLSGGYEERRNNCATYSASEWNRCTGENLASGGWFYDHPTYVNESIDNANIPQSDPNPPIPTTIPPIIFVPIPLPVPGAPPMT